MSNEEMVTREILGNVPGWLVATFYAAAFLSCAFAAAALARRQWKRRRGRVASPSAGPGRGLVRRLGDAIAYVTFHRQLLRDPWPGIAHLLMFYGFVVLTIGTGLVGLEHDTPLHFMYGRFYLWMSLACDLGGLAFLVGLGLFLGRRARAGPSRILREWWVASVGLLLAAIGVTGFVLEAARIAQSFPEFERWSVVGYGLAAALHAAGVDAESAAGLHRACWAGHAFLSVAFFALLPWGFFSHMTYGLASWTGRQRIPIAALPTAPLVLDETPGANRWDELSRTDLLQADGCTTCGRCNDVCPATAAGKPLRPREVVLGLRAAMTAEGDDLREWVPDPAVWSCTTCGACSHACPVGIAVYEKIIDLRRGRVELGDVPPPAERVLEASAAESNPYGRPNADRMAWAAGLAVPVADPGEPVELLYWVGCAGSFDPDGQSVSRAMVRILNHLGIHYRVLGRRERCTGDPARRIGEEGLFHALAGHNAETLATHGVRRILTHCPHCFNTFRNEYPHLRDGVADREVMHHTQFLAELLDSGRVSLAPTSAQAVTFHDPCYLGRGNGEVEAPRKALRALPMVEAVEMPRSGRASFCCGAGGGSMWLDVRGRDRIEGIRYEEARGTGAGTVATGCPFCKVMLRAAGESAGGGGPRVRDLAELVAEAMGL